MRFIEVDTPIKRIKRFVAVITAGFLELIIKSTVIALLYLALYLLDETFLIHDPLLLISLFGLLWVFGVAVGLFFAVASSFVPEVDKIKSMLSRPLLFISCVFFSLQDVPENVWPYLTWNPLVHFNELARFACFESYGQHGVNLSYILEVTTVALFLSLSMYHITWKKVLSR